MSTEQSDKTPSNEETSHRSFSYLSPISFLLALIALLVSCYSLWQLQYKTSQAISTLRTSQSDGATTTSHTIDTFKNSLSSLQKEGALIKKHVTAIANTQNQKENNWQLVKADHLLDIAQLSVYWEHNTHPAIGLLEAADTLINDLHNPSYTPLRKTISGEILALKAVPTVDTVGLLSTIHALSEKLTSLPLSVEHFKQPPATDAPEGTPTDKKAWRSMLDNSLNALSKLVVIRYRQKPLTPLLSPKNQQDLREKIQLVLQQAQWAVIQKNQALYALSLKQAYHAIETNFNTDSTQVNAVLDSLTTLKKENIAPALPDISQSKKLLQDILTQHQGDNA